MLGRLQTPSILSLQPTHPLETVCLLLDLVALSLSFLLVFFLSLEETPAQPLYFTTALSESYLLDIYSQFLFLADLDPFALSWIGKPVLDRGLDSRIACACFWPLS